MAEVLVEDNKNRFNNDKSKINQGSPVKASRLLEVGVEVGRRLLQMMTPQVTINSHVHQIPEAENRKI